MSIKLEDLDNIVSDLNSKILDQMHRDDIAPVSIHSNGCVYVVLFMAECIWDNDNEYLEDDDTAVIGDRIFDSLESLLRYRINELVEQLSKISL